MSYRQSYYTSGSTARKFDNRNYSNEKKNSYKRISERKKAVLQVNALYAVLIVCAILFMAVIAMGYVSLQSEVTALRKEKGQLASYYANLKSSNDLYYENMISNVDLKEVERIAVEELGMKMAGKGQVMTYSDELDDYVKQYSDIPN